MGERLVTILVASTIPAYKLDRPDWCTAWLLHGEAMNEQTADPLRFFAVLEVDGRGIDRFAPVLERLAELDGDYWTFSIDTGVSAITSGERIPRICAARNLMIDYMLADRTYTHVLFLDADTEVPPESITRLLELQHPVAGGHVPTYCLGDDAPSVPFDDRDVRAHWTTAGFLLIERDVLRDVRWGWDPDAGQTDDPFFQERTKRRWGETWVDHDLVAQHHPPAIAPVEQRGLDMRVYR